MRIFLLYIAILNFFTASVSISHTDDYFLREDTLKDHSVFPFFPDPAEIQSIT